MEYVAGGKDKFYNRKYKDAKMKYYKLKKAKEVNIQKPKKNSRVMIRRGRFMEY